MADSDWAGFREGCKRHELLFQKCSSCGLIRWPPAMACPHCLSIASEWIVASGRGKIYTFAVSHVAMDPAFERQVPYSVAVVELEEGPHLVTRIVGAGHSRLACSLPVEVAWDEEAGTIPPLFRLARSEV